MIYYIGISINLFLLLILITKRRKSLADKILAAWLFVMALHIGLFIASLQPVNVRSIHWILGLIAPFPLIHGPFLYLYTAASTNMLPSRKRIWFLHFLPFLLTIVLLLPLYIKSGQEKLAIYMSGGEDYYLFNQILLLAIYVSGIAYIIASFILLRKHRRNIGEQFSYEEKINLNWLRYLIIGLLVLWLIIIVLKKNSIVFSAAAVFVTLIGYLGIRQRGIFGMNEPERIPETSKPIDSITEVEVLPETELPRKKYANSGLNPELALQIHTKLVTAMEREKLFTEPELSLAMLAGKLDVHPNYLSQVINEKEGKSFFDYINTLRVEEFKRLAALPESSQFTLLSLAFDCGFNSKSAFNKNFKKVTGQSPSAYYARPEGDH
ncbi:MAG: helix-turn-helix domain-containing protein [Chitinophagaceae bacterium]